jgi:aminopeptidase N
MPVTIDLYSDGAVERKTITISKSKETFEFPLAIQPSLINFDAEKMLVCVKKDNHTKAEWIYLYEHGKLFLDRLEAIEALKNYLTAPDAQAILIKGLNDHNFEIRKTCINILNEENNQTLYETNKITLQNLAKSDPNSNVRATAITTLASQKSNATDLEIILNACNDSSYIVVQKALKALYLIDKPKAVTIAKQLENSESNYVQMAIAGIYAEQGNKSMMPYFMNQLANNAGNNQVFINKYFKNYLTKVDDETIEKALSIIKSIAVEAMQEKIEFSAKSTLGDMLAAADSEELKEKIKIIMKEIDQLK